MNAELLTLRDVCALFGGSRPIDPSTLYRGIRAGRYPAPIKVGPGSSRWLRVEVEGAIAAMVARSRA
jgi:predicted DNA-binding transcriptional regulator AlpA